MNAATYTTAKTTHRNALLKSYFLNNMNPTMRSRVLEVQTDQTVEDMLAHARAIELQQKTPKQCFAMEAAAAPAAGAEALPITESRPQLADDFAEMKKEVHAIRKLITQTQNRGGGRGNSSDRSLGPHINGKCYNCDAFGHLASFCQRPRRPARGRGSNRGQPRFRGLRYYPQGNFNQSPAWGQGFGARGPMYPPPPPPDHFSRQPEARSSLALETSAWEPQFNYHHT